MKAADKFDPDRGVRFSTYAVWWIKASIQDYVMRNWSIVRTGTTSPQKSLFFNMRRVQARLEREARQAGANLDRPQLRQIDRDRSRRAASRRRDDGRTAQGSRFFAERHAIDGRGRARVDRRAGRRKPPTAEQVEQEHDRETLRRWLAAAMSALNPRERFIVRERKLRDEPRTLESLGNELGLSKERVRQVEVAAFGKMRRSLEAQSKEVRALLT